MAKYYSSTFGKISGKHGNAVAVIRKDGSTYLRLHVPSGNPRTDKQQAHRAKFALTSKSLVPFNPIFKETIGVTNGISTARSYAFKNAIVGEYPNFSIDYEKLMFSFGALEALHDPSAAINEGTMTINWNFKKMYNCHKDDSVSFVIFNKDSNQAIHIKNIAMRSDKEIKIDIYDSWAKSELYLWSYVTRGDKISNSAFVRNNNADNQALFQTKENICNDDKAISHEQNMKIEPTNLPIQSLMKGIMISFIVMLYNILGMFKQIVSTNNIIGNAKNLIHSTYSMTKHIIKDIGTERAPNLDLNATWKAATDVCYSKYHKIYPPVPIYIRS